MSFQKIRTKMWAHNFSCTTTYANARLSLFPSQRRVKEEKISWRSTLTERRPRKDGKKGKVGNEVKKILLLISLSIAFQLTFSQQKEDAWGNRQFDFLIYPSIDLKLSRINSRLSNLYLLSKKYPTQISDYLIKKLIDVTLIWFRTWISSPVRN